MLEKKTQGINGRLDTAEKKNSELEDVAIETIQNEIQKREWKKQNISELWDNFKQPNVSITGVSKEQ